MEHGISCGVYVMAALLAAVRFPAYDEVMFSKPPALFAVDTVSPTAVFEPVKTVGLIRKLLHELAECIAFHAIIILLVGTYSQGIIAIFNSTFVSKSFKLYPYDFL